MTPGRAPLFAVLCLLTRGALACPCQGSSGPAAGVTSPSERLGASFTETTRFVAGAWRPNGTYAPLAPGERVASEDVTAIVGYRPVVPGVVKANKFPTPKGLFTIDDLGGWSKVNDSLFDPDKGSVAKIYNAATS